MANRNQIVVIIICIAIVASGALIAVNILNSGDDDSKNIGVMWRPNSSSESYVYTCRSVEAAGGNLVRIGQIFFDDLEYDDSEN